MNSLRIFLAVIITVSIVSCKDKPSEILPRDAYSLNPEGTVMKSSPDAKSQMVAVIPFAEKITLSENSEKLKPAGSDDRTKWYKTTWNGKTGWVQGESTGAPESVADQIKISFSEQKKNFTSDTINSFESSAIGINEEYNYPGGEMEPARIFFLSNGTMVINSKIFNENYSNTFFQYEFLSGGKLLKIKFIDSTLDYSTYADAESSSQSVFKIDNKDRSITYHVKNNGFFFFNWGFSKK